LLGIPILLKLYSERTDLGITFLSRFTRLVYWNGLILAFGGYKTGTNPIF
jgi:hypothetical protein